MPVICPNKNSKEYKSWENAGISKKDIYTEYVLNNYVLPMYSKDVNKALTIPEVKELIEDYSSISDFGIKDISELKHSGIGAVGAFFKDVLYFSKDANSKTISEEVGHAILQRFVDEKTYNQLLEVGNTLLENRLKKEGRTKQDYLYSIQSSLNVSPALSEKYAAEEEIMKDYVLYDTTGTVAQDLRNIEEITAKLSFLGSSASSVARIWYKIIKGLKKLFSNPDKTEEALALLQSLKKGASAKYDRGYNAPSYMFIPKGNSEVGVSPFAYQRIINDVAATYFNRHSSFNNFEVKLEKIFEDFEEYYDAKTDIAPNDNELMNMFYASTALQIDIDSTDDYGNAKKTTREETIENVKVALKGLGIKVEDDITNLEELEDEAGGHHRWDQSSNQMGAESLSLGLKNIILRVGRKEQIGVDENYNPRILTFAPDVAHIYSGLVRYSSKALTTEERWKRMVEYSEITGNNSSKLLIQDYYLQDFTTKATYLDKQYGTIAEWINVIGSSNFNMNELKINDSILATEFITLLKGLELVSRDMKTTEVFLAEEYTGFKMFDTNSNGIKNRLIRNYGDALNNWSNKLKANPKLYEEFEKSIKGSSIRASLITLLQDSNIFLAPKVKEEILNNTEFGEGTNLQKLLELVDDSVKSGKPLIEKGETQGPLNTVIEAVINLQVEYDESVLENSFTNLEGKTIYGFQRQTPIILTLRSLATDEFLNKFENGSPYIDQNNEFTHNGFKNNPIVNAFKSLSKKERQELSKTFSLDGVYSRNQSGFREDVSFSDMTDRHFAAVSINMMIKATNEISKKSSKGFWTAVTLGHNEASSLIDYNYVPILSPEEIKNSISTLISQEKARIELVESKVNEFIANTNHPIESGLAKITYEQLKEYFKPQGIPVYKGMLEGTYVMKDPITNEAGEKIYPGINIKYQTNKQFQVSKNLKDIITYEELMFGGLNSEQLILNLNTVLDAQIQSLEEMKVIELLDRAIVDVDNINERQKSQNQPAIQAFGLTSDYKRNLKVILTQFWLGSTFSNQILVGDPMVSFKNDFKDILKRHRSYNAALLGVDVPFSVPSLGIYPKSEVKMVMTTSDETSVYGSKIDKDDAQSYSSLDFWLYKQFTKGKLTQNSRNAWLRIQAGEILNYSEIENSGAFMASDKTITAQGNQIVKHSEHYILPNAVAFVNNSTLKEAEASGYFIAEDGKLKILPNTITSDIFVGYEIEGKTVVNKLKFFEHRPKQAEKYLILEGYAKVPDGYVFKGGIDIKTVTTASKGAQKNVIDRGKLLEEFSTNPEYFTQSLAANTYGDQVENPQGKDYVIDASQNQEIKPNEIENAKDIVEKYFNNQSSRNNFEIDLVLKELYGPNYKNEDAKLEAKQFLEAISRVMKDSGTDNQKLDFLTFKQIGDEFVANYNLNLPPIRQKFTQSLFKLFTKALRHKVAGNSLVQVSSSDYNVIKKAKLVKDVTVTLPDGTKAKQDIITWDVVSPEEYEADANKISLGDLSALNYNGKNQIEGKEDQLTQEILNAGLENVYFFDEVRFMKPYINTSNELEYFVSEAIMPPWFDENIPEELRQQYGVRIPSQDKQSSVAIEWVSSFEAALGNSIVVPKEIIYLSGSDFDIDKLFTQRVEGFFEKGKFFAYENNFEHFKKYMFTKKTFFTGGLRDALKNSEKYQSVLKEFKEKLEEKQELYNKIKSQKDLVSSMYLELTANQVEELKKSEKFIARKGLENLFNISRLNSRIRNIEKELRDMDLLSEASLNLEEERYEAIQEIVKIENDQDEIFKSLGYEEMLKSDRNIAKSNKELLENLKDFMDQANTSFKQIKETKEKLEEIAKISLLEKYNYPTSQSNYNITYPAVINNDQLRISSKLLSEPEVIYGEQGSIYETPATVKPYEQIFENYQIEVEKGTQRERELLKLNVFKEEKENTTVFYPYKTEKGESIFLKDAENIQTFSLLNFANYQQAVQAAKAGIGLLANANVLGIFAKKMGINLKTPIVFEGKEFKEFKFKTEKNRRVFDAISSTISVTTDEAKESQLSNHGISTNDLKVMSVLMLHGFDIEDAFAVTRSKGAKTYNKLLERNKIDRERVYVSNDALVSEFLKDVVIPDFSMSRVEFEGISTISENILEKKYFKIYSDILGMYSELSNLIPAVKIKTGVANNIADFQRSLNGLNNSYNSEENFTYYNLPKLSTDFNNALDIYDSINKVVKKELVEMKPIFTEIVSELESSITRAKRDYSLNINNYIDQFLLGEYAQSITPGLFSDYETFTESLLEKRDRLFKLSNDFPEDQVVKDSLNYLNKIIQVKEEKIVLNFEGKLNQSLKDSISDSWLLLKHSPINIVREIADDLFKYYFLKDAMQYKPGSLEILFPASKFKGVSEIYDTILNKESTPSQETIDKFSLYLASTNPEYFKNHDNYLLAFNAKDKNDLFSKVKFNTKNGKTESIEIINIADAPKIVVVSNQMFFKKEKKYFPIQPVLASEFNNYLVRNQEIDKIYNELLFNDSLSEPKVITSLSSVSYSSMSEITNHSGGAYGGDTFWDVIGREYGVTNHKHYKDSGNANLSQKLRNAGVKATILSKEQMDKARVEVENLLGKKYPDTLEGNLQVRNYYQVANSDAVYAVAQLADENGKAIKSYLFPTIKGVTGGTNTAIQLGIKLGKPVYVWDIGLKTWFTWNGEYFTTTETPVLTKNFAGVGSRDIESYNVLKEGKWVPRTQYKGEDIEEAAKQAIRDVYQKTTDSLNQKSVENIKSINKEEFKLSDLRMLPEMAFQFEGDNYRISEIEDDSDSDGENYYSKNNQTISDEEFLKVYNRYTSMSPIDKDIFNKVEITSYNYTRQEVKNNPATAYVFTENTHSITAFPNTQGGGSAIIRPEPNAFAIVTKKKYDYNTKENVDYIDTEENFKEFVDINTKLINDIKNSGKSKIIFPQGFATDKAKMPTRFAKWLQKELLDNFGLETMLNKTDTGLLSMSIQGGKYNNDLKPEIGDTEILEKYEIFPGVEANEQQKIAIDKFTDFLDGKIQSNNQNTFASLLGLGGTGKTTIIKKIIGDKRVLYLAPTHKAKEVLKMATGAEAKTLASALGVSMDEITGKFQRIEFDSNKLAITKFKLIVIDESSMINDEYLQLVKENISPGAKVIFMGDSHQLPPVGQDENSSVFKYKLHELTERMRQGESSPIVPVTDLVANNIDADIITRRAIINRTNNFNESTNQGVIFEKSLENAFKMWQQDFKLNPQGTKIVTFNNENNSNPQSVKSLNIIARNILFNNPTEEFVDGEQVTGYDQYGDPEDPDLLNSVDYTVLNSKKQEETNYRVVAFSKKLGTREVSVKVSGYNLELENNINKRSSTLFVLDSKSKNLVRSKVNELYNGENKDSQLATVLNKYFPKLEHGYAITTHKSQGSTYKSVYVMEDNILGNTQGSDKSVNQSLYVAVSRPSDKLVIVSNKNPSSYNSENNSNFDENNSNSPIIC